MDENIGEFERLILKDAFNKTAKDLEDRHCFVNFEVVKKVVAETKTSFPFKVIKSLDGGFLSVHPSLSKQEVGDKIADWFLRVFGEKKK